MTKPIRALLTHHVDGQYVYAIWLGDKRASYPVITEEPPSELFAELVRLIEGEK